MAATWISTIHAKGSNTAITSVAERLNYILDDNKTDNGKYICSFECDTADAAYQFNDTREEYELLTGHSQSRDNCIIAYHVRQAFLPGEVDADTTNQLGFELAMEITKGNNAFVVATHTDRDHIHNHIIFNAYNLDCEGKFRNVIGSYKYLREMSDDICKQNNLSIIENPDFSRGYYSKANEYQRQPSKRDELEEFIDKIIDTHHPKDFDNFIEALRKAGCEVKDKTKHGVGRKQISFKLPSQKRFIRMDTLSENYTEEALLERFTLIQPIEQPPAISISKENPKAISPPQLRRKHDTPPIKAPEHIQQAARLPDAKIQKIIDICNLSKAQESAGYKKWVSSFNLQQAAQTLIFLQSQNVNSMEEIDNQIAKISDNLSALQSTTKTTDKRLDEISKLQKHIGAYSKNREIYLQYIRSKRDTNFRAENMTAIESCESAKAYFDTLGLERVPTIQELRAEYSDILSQRNKDSTKRETLTKELNNFTTAKKNINAVLGHERPEKAVNSQQQSSRVRKKSEHDR